MVTLKKRLLYSSIFNDEKQHADFYLRQISTLIGLRLGSALIHAALNSSFPLSEPEFVDRWFSEPNRDIARKLAEYLKGGSALLNAYSSIKLNEAVLGLSPIEEGEEGPEVEVLLLKAYLVFNDEQYDKESACVHQLRELDISDEEKIIGFVTSFSFPDYDLANYDTRIVISAQMYKATEFFKYLENKNLKHHLRMFLEKYGVESWREWLKNYYAFVLPLTSKEYHGSFYDITLDPTADNYGKNLHYIKTLSLGDEEDYSMHDFVKMRSNPLYQIDVDQYQVLYKLFAIEKLFKSIVFEFSLEINNALPKAQQVSNFRSEFCGNFSENVILYKVMADSFSEEWIHLTGKTFVENGHSGEPDYYLRRDGKVYLFESKDVVLRGSTKQSRNYIEISAALKKKFWYEEKTKKTVNRSIKQLIQMIENSQNAEYEKLDSAINLTSCRYYPIIICHDRQFDSLGVNSLLAEWWEQELSNTGLIEIKDRIARPVVLNIDNLITFQDIFLSETINLSDLIEGYWTMVDENRRGSTWAKEINDNTYQSFLSFSDFLTDYIAERNLWRIPSFIMPYGAEALK